MNTIINSLTDKKLIRQYELDILSESESKLFLPLSYEMVSKDKGEECLSISIDISNMDPIGTINDGGEAPYVASGLISGMENAMYHYILPWHYEIRRSLLYLNKKKEVKLVYEPTMVLGRDMDIPGNVIRTKCAEAIKEVFPHIQSNTKEKIVLGDIVSAVVEYLQSPSIGYETCKRKIEKLKEEAYYLRPTEGFNVADLLDLYE